MKTFDNLFLLARAASGKSELIDFLKSYSIEDRTRTYHIGKFDEIDDYPWIWETCLEDDKREAKGEKRLYTEKTKEGTNLTVPKFRGTLIEKFNKEITEKYLSKKDYYRDNTLFIEFARGLGDGFKENLEKFKEEILANSAILFIKVSFEESVRRNNARYKINEEGSILFHKVPDKDMYGFFSKNDWDEITESKESGFLKINNIDIPFVTMNNEPELPPGTEAEKRYRTAFDELFNLYEKNR